MIADIGTRKGASIQDVNAQSTWINGFDWMRKYQLEFPIKSYSQLRLSELDIRDESVKNSYTFSNYQSKPLQLHRSGENTRLCISLHQDMYQQTKELVTKDSIVKDKSISLNVNR